MNTLSSAPTDNSYPGRTLGIVGLIVAFPASLIGLILSIVALVQSRKAGRGNIPATVGIVVAAVLTVVWVIVGIVLVVVFVNLAGTCAGLGPGTHYVDGVTYTCS